MARRGRGIDFEHRFRTSRWAEDLLHDAINSLDAGLVAVRLGLSQVSVDGVPVDDDVDVKEPDLLIFDSCDLTQADRELLEATDLTVVRASRIAEDRRLSELVSRALVGIEVEFSPYRAAEMKGRDWQPKSREVLARRQLKHANPPVAPNIWIKAQDLPRLKGWSRSTGVPILVVHLFDQEGFAIPLDQILRFDETLPADAPGRINAQLASGIFKKLQSYDRVDAQGAGEKKEVFVVTPAASIFVGKVHGVRVEAQLGTSTSKKYVSHVVFSGGLLTLEPAFVSVIQQRGRILLEPPLVVE